MLRDFGFLRYIQLMLQTHCTAQEPKKTKAKYSDETNKLFSPEVQ